jgi:dTDP-4-dehydrorhamnose reductase
VSLSRAICGLTETGASGVFHVTDGGSPVTWFHFAEKVLSLQDLFVPIEPLTTESLGRPAARPAYSVLDCSGTEAVLQCSLPLWPDMLGEYLRRRAG